MPTTKKRLNISLPSDLEAVLAKTAERDDIPQATKAVQLLRIAIEIDEDDIWNDIAESRDIKDAKFLSHKDAWA